MKIILSVCMFLMVFTSLHSAQNSVELVQPDVYPKKIVFGTYSKKSSAKYEFYTFRKDKVYKELYELAQKNNFMIHYRPLAEYTILVIEPIQKRKIFLKALNLVQQKYPKAYHLSAEGLDEPMVKPLPPLMQKNSVEVDPVKALNADKTQPCNTDEISSKVEEPIFNVEEVSDTKMAVNCEPSTKQQSKKTTKELPAKVETTIENNDAKEQIANEVQKTEVKKEVSKKTQPVEKNSEQKVQAKKAEKSDKKEESFFGSILNFFTNPKAQTKEVKKESATKKTNNVDKTIPEDMDVPELDEPIILNEKQEEAVSKKEINKQETVQSSQMNEEVSSDINVSDSMNSVDMDNMNEDNQITNNDANMTQKSSDEKKDDTPELAKYKVKTVQDDNKTITNQVTEIDKKLPKVEKVESPKTEKSYFTFSNILIGLFLIFSPFLYRKFRKVKSIYDQY